MDQNKQSNLWVFKSVADEDRSYRSISAYDDDLTTRYNYDSNVANCKQVKEGDLAIIINKVNILGFARISIIETSEAKKEIRKCPYCGSTNFEERKSKNPKYRCNHGHEFDEYVTIVQDVTQYKADYGDTFNGAKEKIPISILKPYYSKGYNRNMSIQYLDMDFFKQNYTNLPNLLEKGLKTTLLPSDALNEEEGPYNPNNYDERDKVQRQIRARRGQRKFRNALRNRYGDICMITGCDIFDIVEAAHINPFKGDKDHHVTNGILLRSDLHTLFDLNLIGIHPETLLIHVTETIQCNGYEQYHLQMLRCCTEAKRPNHEALLIRWREFNSSI